MGDCGTVDDPCSSNPCSGSATCGNNGDGTFTCTFPDPCANTNPCQNGGSCNNNGDGSYSCGCVGDFTGQNCECDGQCGLPDDTNIFETQWPSNDNCQEDNRAGVASTPTSWNICAANSFFEPGDDGAFRYLVYFAPGSPFTQEDVAWNCDSADDYTYAIYSFPQNYLKKDGRSNIRKYGNNFDTTVSLSLGAQVVNFTVDDPRITVNTADNQNYILTDIPNIEEVWFQFEYANSFFLSNTVGVAGSS